MNAESRSQYSMPSGGIVFIVLADIDTTLFGLGLSRWLHGYTRNFLMRFTAAAMSLFSTRPRSMML